MIDATTISTIVIDAIRAEWVTQGHSLTGAFEQSLKAVVTQGDSIIIQIVTDKEYGVILNEGVPAANIPYSGRSGKGGTSKYIQGLVEYAKRRMGASDKDAVSIAFAIANKHKEEGMPTANSAKFSKTGQRTKYLEAVDEKIRDEIKDQILNTIVLPNLVRK